MAEQSWYWADGENQIGPVPAAELIQLVKDGRIGADHMVWKDGLADWIPVSRVPGLVKHIPAAGAFHTNRTSPAASATSVSAAPVYPVATAFEPALAPTMAPKMAPTASSVSYYSPGGGMPQRAMQTLIKHAKPTGDVGDWPLDDVRVIQFEEALKLRKQVDGAASLFRLLFLIGIIADVVMMIDGLAALGSTRSNTPEIGMFFLFIFMVGISFLYYFAWQATKRSQQWAPLTMGILFVLGGVVNLGQIILLSSNSRSGAGGAGCFGVVLVMGVAGAFAFVAFRAYAAIPNYLRQPAWCQELLSKTSS